MTHNPPGWAAHEAMVAPARARPEIWRVLLGAGLIVAVVVALNAALAGVVSTMAPDFWRHEITGGPMGTTPMSMLLLLLSFGFFTVGAGLAAMALHNRSLLSLIGPLGPALSQFRVVMLMLVAVSVAIMILPPYATNLGLEPNLAPGTWVTLLPLSLGALLFQVSAEEILFRGYLQSQLAARFQSPWIWMGVPALLFALGHYMPEEAGENALLITLWAGVFGLMMSDLTARSGTLGPAIAVHFANNITALLFISVTDSMSGLALYVSPAAADDPALIRAWLPVDFASMLVFWLAARLALRR